VISFATCRCCGLPDVSQSGAGVGVRCYRIDWCAGLAKPITQRFRPASSSRLFNPPHHARGLNRGRLVLSFPGKGFKHPLLDLLAYVPFRRLPAPAAVCGVVVVTGTPGSILALPAHAGRSTAEQRFYASALPPWAPVWGAESWSTAQ